MNTLLQNEPAIRLTVFLGVLTTMAMLELAAPRRRLEIPRIVRWSNNLGLVVIDTILVRLFFPVAAVGMAIIAAQNGWGLFNMVSLPAGLVVLVSILLLDLAIYVQHVVFHFVPFLWRLHLVHHTDQDFDVTTGLRFHPLEILVSMAIKLAFVVLLGVPANAVLVFEIALNATAMFNHANIRIPARVDQALRFFIVTPDMHRVHHSVRPVETNSNFGFNLSWWDHLLGTYRAQPEDGHDKMGIGLAQFRSQRDQGLDRMLLQPLLGGGSTRAKGLMCAGDADIAILPRLRKRFQPVQATDWITVEELSKLMETDNAPVIIDVREPDEFGGPMGAIPGSRNVPLGVLLDQLPEPEKDVSIVLVCRTDKRSAKGASLLKAVGFSGISILKGGMRQWCNR